VHVSARKNLKQTHQGLHVARFGKPLFTTREVSRHSQIARPEVSKPLKQSAIQHWELGSVLTITEVADILRVHPTTIYRLVKRGELPGFKIGGCWRINRASLDKWLSGGITGHP
jgi:excisionase family DNA binding protein